jgi:hypothetical protein
MTAPPINYDYDPVSNALLEIPDQWGFMGKVGYLVYALLESRREEDIPILNYLATKRWMDNSDGVWLDEIGDIIGLARMAFVDTDNVFTFRGTLDVNDPTKGFSGATPPQTGGRIQGFDPLTTDVYFGDLRYRRWITAKALTTNTDATHDDLYTFVKAVYQVESEVRTTATREVTIQLLSPLSQGARQRLAFMAPVSAGVKIVVKNP